ncbi:metallophosphoesterase family protein [Paenibacillus thermoaerophilus]|uniref:Metallophosphoesterase family protein n=1 Tax=Paenibacillus thermoaerophilus TaxID=1215385 RepID=A0ABW2V3L0_9BACL|nr:metallophosphoesterase [Paenibacillus thermoaerophilus]TMV18534.1 phosphohydrolase [Paenibacillus thermoaerophilus]
MDRRSFLKRLLGLLVIGAAGAGGWAWWRGRESGAPTSVALPSSQPVPASFPSSTPQAAEATEPIFSFFIFSDTHINPDLPKYTEHLHQAIKDTLDFKEGKVEAIVITGDVTDYGRDRDYKEFLSIIGNYKLPPLMANMGNHDYYSIHFTADGKWSSETAPNGKKDADSRERFMKVFNYEKPYNDFWINGCHIIMLSQEAYIQERPEVGEGAWYSDEQLEWLKEKLKKHADGSPAFVMIHQPLPAIGQDGGSHRLIRAKAFREILKPYKNVFVFSGHTHRDFRFVEDHYVKETFHWFHNSSVARVNNRQYQEVAAKSSQGMYVEVFADRVRVRGREFSDRSWIKGADWTVKLV